MKREVVGALFLASALGAACGNSSENFFDAPGGKASAGRNAGGSAGMAGGGAGGTAGTGGIPIAGGPTAGSSGTGPMGGAPAGGNAGRGGAAAGIGGMPSGGASPGGNAGTAGASGSTAGGGIGGAAGAAGGGKGGTPSEAGFDCGSAPRCQIDEVCVTCRVGASGNVMVRCAPHPVVDPVEYGDAVAECTTDPTYEECDGPEDCDGEYCVAKAEVGGSMRCRSMPAGELGSCCFACGAPLDCTLCRKTADCPDPEHECAPVLSGPAGLMGCQ
jgi:hypothetical protein